MEELLKNILSEIQSVKTQLNTMETKIDTLDTKVDRYGTEQQKDIYTLLQSMNDKVATKRDVEGILKRIEDKTVSAETLERIEIKLDILTHRTLAQDGEIQLLKKAK